jgi:hypothetical protein
VTFTASSTVPGLHQQICGMGRILVDLHVVHGSQVIDEGMGDEVQSREAFGVAVHAV